MRVLGYLDKGQGDIGCIAVSPKKPCRQAGQESSRFASEGPIGELKARQAKNPTTGYAVGDGGNGREDQGGFVLFLKETKGYQWACHKPGCGEQVGQLKKIAVVRKQLYVAVKRGGGRFAEGMATVTRNSFDKSWLDGLHGKEKDLAKSSEHA